MDALLATYGDNSSDSDSDADADAPPSKPSSSSHSSTSRSETTVSLPPPPLTLLNPPNLVDLSETGLTSRIRSFPHVDGNFAIHVYIPVYIPFQPKKEMAQFLEKIATLVPSLNVVDADVPLQGLCKDDHQLEQVALGREFHISLGRTVPIRVHQIKSMVEMLRQKLQFQRRYWIDFNKWEVFVNDEHTCSFLSIEVTTGGLTEITNQIRAVNEVYKLHNLPEFYKDPRPHISLAWAVGDISNSLKAAVEETKRSQMGGSVHNHIFTSKFSGIVCKIGKKTHKICKFPVE